MTWIAATAGAVSCGGPFELDTVPFFDIPLEVDHNREYRAEVNPPTGWSVEALEVPEWLTWDEAGRTIEGTAGWDHRGKHRLAFRARNEGGETRVEELQLIVHTGKVDCSQKFGAPEASPYVLPYPVGRTSTVTQSYCRTGPGGHHDTYAYDFAMAMADTILAARGGLVYRVQESYADGNGVPGRENFVYVEHEDGTVARYVHLLENGALVAVGESLQAGDVLGLNGLTGGTSRPHLHFEVFRNRSFNDSTTDFAKRFSLPVNFRNAEGPLDARGGLIEDASYTARD